MKKLYTDGDTLGAYLKRKRKDIGMSLEELSEKTHIGINYLENIEKSEFNKLPCLPYNRGFVRAYAAYIGTDANAAAHHFNTEFDLEGS